MITVVDRDCVRCNGLGWYWREDVDCECAVPVADDEDTREVSEFAMVPAVVAGE